MYGDRFRKRAIVFQVIDLLSIMGSYLIACYLNAMVHDESVSTAMNYSVNTIWLIFLTYFVVALFFNKNGNILKRDRYEEFLCVVKMDIWDSVVLGTFFYLAHAMDIFGRSIWLFTICFNLVFLFLFHEAAKGIMKESHQNQRAKQHMLIVTTAARADKVARQVTEADSFKDYVFSIAIVDQKDSLKEVRGISVCADRSTMVDFARREIVDEVYVNLPHEERMQLKEEIDEFAGMGIVVHININMLEGKDGFSKQIDQIGEYPVVSFAPRFYDSRKLIIKRLVDIVGSIVGLIFTGILTLFVAPAILLESPGPLIFKQRRVGRNGRFFYIYKFRSMYRDAEARKAELMKQNEMKGLMFKMTDDPRVTKVGKFIRATSIDELPQFWNILKGDMSLVGTRPPTVDEFVAYENHHKRRLTLKPGLTGLWQVSGRSNIEDFEEVVRLDCEYLDNWSFSLDIKILLKTVGVVFKKVGSK